MALARSPKIMFIAGLLSLAVACGVPAPQQGSASLGTGGSPAGAAAAQAANELEFGTDHRFANGVTISVAAPKSFRPSSAAYPNSPRAAAFDIAVVNAGTDTFKLSGLSVVATTASGATVKQVVDTAQGFNGIADAGKDVLPGHSVLVTLAFAVPQAQTTLRLQVRPSTTEPTAVTYCGPA
jgi:hypothetical protein